MVIGMYQNNNSKGNSWVGQYIAHENMVMGRQTYKQKLVGKGRHHNLQFRIATWRWRVAIFHSMWWSHS